MRYNCAVCVTGLDEESFVEFILTLMLAAAHPPIGELLALLTALLWAVSSIIYSRVAKYIPPLELNFFKGLCALLLVALVLLLGGQSWSVLTPKALLLLLASGVLGIGLGGLLILLEVLIADVIDEDETRTGHRREGMYFGVNGFIIRLGVSLQAVVTGLVLNTSGYNAYAAVQPATAVIGIRFLIAGVPLVALVLALISIWLYPLHGAKLAAVKEAIANLNRKGAPM